MNDPYSILGVSAGATDEQIKSAYKALAKKYHPDNFSDDNPLKELAKEKMQQINDAYDQIQTMRRNGTQSNQGAESNQSGQGNQGGYQYTGVYAEIRRDINARRFRDAENRLDSIGESERTADWHFLYSICLMHRGRHSDAMRELEIACSMDPSNIEYQRAKEQFNGRTNAYGSTYYGDGDNHGYRRRSSADDACDCCSNLICLDCCCEMMGGDLIPCC